MSCVRRVCVCVCRVSFTCTAQQRVWCAVPDEVVADDVLFGAALGEKLGDEREDLALRLPKVRLVPLEHLWQVNLDNHHQQVSCGSCAVVRVRWCVCGCACACACGVPPCGSS